MKRMISWVLVLVMMLSLFAGCANEAEPTTAPEAATEVVVAADNNLENAIAFLKTYYKGAGGLTPADFERLGTIRVADVAYEVVYTVDCDESTVKVVKGENGMVTIDVNEESDKEVPYVLTATITGTDGKTASLTWDHIVPISMAGRSDEIIDSAYALADGEALGYEATLKGVITNIDTPYSPDYKNITVTIQVEGREDKPIMCYRLKGEGADALVVGDTITVTGTLKNYKGTIEFDAGCILDEVLKTGEAVEVPTDPAEIVKAAFELEPGQDLPYNATLTGVITAFDGGFSEKYGNVTVTIRVEGKDIVCFRMKGEGANSLHINDTITVTGIIKNYYGTIEFDAGCQLVEVVDGVAPTGPKDPLKHIDAAYKLDPGCALNYPSTLTGTIVSVDQEYSENYGNITVTIKVAGRESNPIQCFRMKGTDIDKIGRGDVITVRGWLMNYKGTIEFTAGCRMLAWTDLPEPELPEPDEGTEFTLAEANELGNSLENKTFTKNKYYVSGVITEIKSDYYGNLYINDGTDSFYLYGLKGNDGSYFNKLDVQPKVGDTVKVYGIIGNYNGAQMKNPIIITHTVAEPEGTEPEATEPEVTEPEETTPVLSTPAEIMDAAYALESGKSLDGTYTLSGKIVSVDTAYSAQYKNVTVTIKVDGSGKNIQCFRLKGTGADVIAIGDTITVTGKIKNYNGTIEFDTGCSLDSYKKAEVQLVPVEIPEGASQADIVKLAYSLEKGNKLASGCTLTGVITKINTAYSEQYKNVTVTIVVGGDEARPIMCYRLKGEGADSIAVGDTITVSGIIKNYNGTIEFDSGCSLLSE